MNQWSKCHLIKMSPGMLCQGSVTKKPEFTLPYHWPLCGQERRNTNERGCCRQCILDLLWPSAYQKERPLPDKDNSLPDLTPALTGPPIAPAECKYHTEDHACLFSPWRLEGVAWPLSATRHMLERGEREWKKNGRSVWAGRNRERGEKMTNSVCSLLPWPSTP